MPPPLPFVRSQRRRSIIVETSPISVLSHSSGYFRDNRDFTLQNSTSYEQGSGRTLDVTHELSARARYNRDVGQYINQTYSFDESFTVMSQGALDDLEWILTLEDVPLHLSGSRVLRDQITRIVSLEAAGHPDVDMMQFPDPNESR